MVLNANIRVGRSKGEVHLIKANIFVINKNKSLNRNLRCSILF